MIVNKIEDGLIDPSTMTSGIHTGTRALTGGSESHASPNAGNAGCAC